MVRPGRAGAPFYALDREAAEIRLRVPWQTLIRLPMTTTVYKILTADEWQAAERAGSYAGSADDARDGFIHLSTAEQLAGTAGKHFRGKPDLVLVAFDAASLGPGLKWEPSRGGALFPHLYAALPTAPALRVEPLPLGPDGVPILPQDLRP
jgi:uncharacterized protein (DUF952 family)